MVDPDRAYHTETLTAAGHRLAVCAVTHRADRDAARPARPGPVRTSATTAADRGMRRDRRDCPCGSRPTSGSAPSTSTRGRSSGWCRSATARASGSSTSVSPIRGRLRRRRSCFSVSAAGETRRISTSARWPTGTPMTYMLDGRQYIVLAYGTRQRRGVPRAGARLTTQRSFETTTSRVLRRIEYSVPGSLRSQAMPWPSAAIGMTSWSPRTDPAVGSDRTNTAPSS